MDKMAALIREKVLISVTKPKPIQFPVHVQTTLTQQLQTKAETNVQLFNKP